MTKKGIEMRHINLVHKKPNKKIIFLAGLLLVLLAALIIFGMQLLQNRQEPEPSLEEIVTGKLNAYQTDLTDSMDSMQTNRDVAQYLLAWGKNKGISCSMDSQDNVAFTLQATSEKMKDRNPVIFLCEYDVSDLNASLEPIASALTIAKNTAEHGKVRIVFAPSEGIGSSGISALPASWFTDRTEVFCLGKSAASKISAQTGGYLKFRLSEQLHAQKPSYDKAYRIYISGLPAESPANPSGNIVNPIKQLGSVLANFKSTSLLFELANFHGGKSADLTPSGASMTVVINRADDAKFIKKMDNALEKFYNKYADQYPDAVYTYEEIPLPKRVFAKEDAENIVSLMYTAFNGIYYKDDDGNVIALTNIGRISTKEQNLKVEVSVMSCAQDYLDEITEAYRTICGLCNIHFSVRDSFPVYEGGTGAKALRGAFGEAFYAYSGDSNMKINPSAEFTPCSLLAEINGNMPILFCSVTDKTKEKLTGAFITYLLTEPDAT